jgi:hypothetical protein
MEKPLQTIRILVVIALIALVAYSAIDLAIRYRVTVGSPWERLIVAGRDSATILWQRFVIIVAGLAGSLGELADWLNEPALKEAIQASLKPEYVAVFTVAVALVTIVARKRTLGR